MKHFLELDSRKSQDIIGAVAATVQELEGALGQTTTGNIVMGMQHELGMVAAYTLGDNPDPRELASALLAIAGLATIYLKAITQETDNASDE